MSYSFNTIQFANYLTMNSHNLLAFDNNCNLIARAFLLDPFHKELNLFFKAMTDSKRFVLDSYYEEPISLRLLEKINFEFKTAIEHLIASHKLVSYLDNILQGQ